MYTDVATWDELVDTIHLHNLIYYVVEGNHGTDNFDSGNREHCVHNRAVLSGGTGDEIRCRCGAESSPAVEK